MNSLHVPDFYQRPVDHGDGVLSYTIQKKNKSHINPEVLRDFFFCLFHRPYCENCRPLPSIMFGNAFDKIGRVTKEMSYIKIKLSNI